MTQSGKIVIKDKVYFEPKGLEKPTKEMFKCYSILIQEKAYNKAMKEYEASKQLIEVNNDLFYEIEHIISAIDVKEEIIYIENGQKCEAEVENNVATIIKIN